MKDIFGIWHGAKNNRPFFMFILKSNTNHLLKSKANFNFIQITIYKTKYLFKMTLYIAEVFNNFFISKLHGYLICLRIIDKISLVYL